MDHLLDHQRLQSMIKYSLKSTWLYLPLLAICLARYLHAFSFWRPLTWQPLLLILGCLSLSAYAQKDASLTLSVQEQQWLAQNPLVTLAYDGHYPPYSFVNDANVWEGFSVDLFKIISEKTGIEFQTHAQTQWDDVYKSAIDGDIDIIAAMTPSTKRQELFHFSQPYIFKDLTIISREDNNSINTKVDLNDKTIAVAKSSQYIEKLLQDHPSVNIKYYDTILATLNAVSVGEADATITFIAAGHFLRNKFLLSNLKYAAMFDENNTNESIAVAKDQPILSTIINKALGSISAEQLNALRAKWLPLDDLEELREINLTDAEITWIKKHPSIRLGSDPEYAPFEFVEAQQYQGMASDYIKLLNQRLNLKMAVDINLSWNQSIEKIKAQEIDVLPVTSITPQRNKYLLFSQPYLNFHRVIVTRSESEFISGLDDLTDKVVATQLNTSHHEFLLLNSDIKPTAFDSLQNALLAVANGQADAYVGNIAAISYWIRKLNLTNLSIAAPASVNTQKLRFAVRNDWPELVSILNKGLNSISARQKKTISEKWLSIHYTPAVNYRLIWQVVAGFLVLVFISVIWNLILNRKVKLRTSQLSYSANYDKLTGLPNRFLILDRLKERINESKFDQSKISVIFIDINDFKSINEIYGHKTGDQVLRLFAYRLKSLLRENQQIGRLNGDQFLIIQSDITDAIDSTSLLQQILEDTKKPIKQARSEISLSASIGVSIYPDDTKHSEELLKFADAAARHVKKQSSGNYQFYTKRLNQNNVRRLTIERNLYRAIENNEFEVYFQPKLQTNTKKPMSFEGLLRWHNIELGEVSPAEFIPIAEKHPIINEIGFFVIEQALIKLKQWQAQYATQFSVAINLSPVQFNNKDLIFHIEKLLKKYQLNNNLIEFEITEGVLLSNLSDIGEKLLALNKLGVSLAMDDFGTGYSSLSYLRKYRFDTLKIDKEFIAELPHSTADKKLVPAIIAMAHELDMKVVAEGVETQMQYDYLIEHKCDFVQGWLFSKALNSEDMNHYLDQQFKRVNPAL